jgi:hypothetical protein
MLEDDSSDFPPPLQELTQAVFALRQELTRAVTESLVEQAHRAVVEQRTAPQTWRPLVVRAIDGADGPTRPETAKGRRPGRKEARAKRARWTGQWRKAKGFRN